MSANDRRGSDDHQVPASVGPELTNQELEELVAHAEPGPRPSGPSQDRELVAQEQVLDNEVAAPA